MKRVGTTRDRIKPRLCNGYDNMLEAKTRFSHLASVVVTRLGVLELTTQPLKRHIFHPCRQRGCPAWLLAG